MTTAAAGGAGTTQTAEEIAAAAASAANAGKTPEQVAADKTAADKVAADKVAADAAAAAAPKPPDKYTLAIPETAKDYLDATDLKTIETVARAKGWTNEQAQAAVAEHAEALAGQSAAFRAATEADPTYGGEKLAETQRLATLALDKLRPKGTPTGDALRAMLVKTGYGNNIQVVSLLADLGKLMAEDSPAAGGAGGGAGGKKDPAAVLYGAPAK